jgi:hypothetical protein
MAIDINNPLAGGDISDDKTSSYSKLGSVPFILSFFAFLMIGITLISTSGCSPGTAEWREEVQLSDGRVIVIDRETLFEEGGGEIALNSRGIKPKERRIRFRHPDKPNALVEWKSTQMTPALYPEKSLILDMEAGNPVLYGSVYVRDRCEKYLKYLYKNSNWTEVALPASFPELKTNLLLKDGSGMRGFYNLEEKKKINKDDGYRKSLKKVGPNREICE